MKSRREAPNEDLERSLIMEISSRRAWTRDGVVSEYSRRQ